MVRSAAVPVVPCRGRMARELDIGIKIVGGETVRESDGLAQSSRNRYLSDEQRKRALLLSIALSTVTQLAAGGQRNIAVLESAMRQTLLGTGGSNLPDTKGVDRIDYAVVVDAQTLSPIAELDRPAVALIAALVGNTRLIDNRPVPAATR